MLQHQNIESGVPNNKTDTIDQILGNYGPTNRFLKNHLLFSQNQTISNIYWIHKGWVKLHKMERSQRCSILKIEGDKSFVGLSDTWEGTSHRFGATSLTPLEVTEIDREKFKALLDENPEMASEVMTFLARDAMYYLDRLTSRHHKQLPGRVADTLLYFYELFNQKPDFQFLLSRTELAQFAGTTKESLIRTLSEFKHDRIINLNDRDVEILSLEIVRTLSRLG
ncbi:MAG: Crp/Fnr family transcriptional regulator [Bacteroidota bacterium]